MTVITGVTEPEALASEPPGRTPAWWGMVLFVATEATLFACLLASYYYLRFLTVGEWPPPGIKKPELAKPLGMTALLLLSSGWMVWADWAVRHNRKRTLRVTLAFTVLFGAGFLTLQGTEYLTKLEEFTYATNAYGSLFYVITGFHGMHVFTGLVMLSFTLVAALAGKFSHRHHKRVRIVSFYWHFVDGIWLAILFTVYISPRL
ncbi:heme-copper oxidase subunit III [Nonomuraea phyllanthi]|uniref:cytochrome-c oxidase n=1 Tax=Nonomuraea phyllanthi TaxID=2219224 RepID=A0A5C4WUY0_9ACTN|nr:heme-copper oxidase subunit III [Nonomuraea phyllanthi]KAB8197414.1 heme-copper oxidase subunit III [Nonomuraea phyllanthi]QFY06593.1 heme-copper oxidase subunit III [Nonomuraea phyllanthi]